MVRKQLKLSAAAAIIGFLDSMYLAILKWTDTVAACSNIGDCEAVNNSPYAALGGFPIALLGAGLYALIVGSLFVEWKLPQHGAITRMIVFALALAGTLYSGYLTYIEIFVLKAICPYCVVSALLLVGVLWLSIIRLKEAGEFL